MITKCVRMISILLRLQTDIDVFHQLQLHLTSQIEHQSRLGIVRVSFREKVNYIHNLAPTSIITSTNSKPKKCLTWNLPMTSDMTLNGGK